MAAVQVLECRVVRRYHSGSGSGFDRHVGDRHAAFHVEGADGSARVFKNGAGAPADADAGDKGEDDVLRGNAGPEGAGDVDAERLRRSLLATLRGENVFHLTGTDTESERTHGAMSRGVAIAADYGHARLGESQFRTDYVHDALMARMHAVVRDTEFPAVGF